MSENSKLDREQLNVDLNDLCKKHNLKDGAFCAVHVESEEYVGNLAIPDPTYQAYMMSSLNVGRLWQHARENIRKIMGEFEK